MLTNTTNNKTEQLSQIMFLSYGILKMMYLITSRNKVQEPSKIKCFLYVPLHNTYTKQKNLKEMLYLLLTSKTSVSTVLQYTSSFVPICFFSKNPSWNTMH